MRTPLVFGFLTGTINKNTTFHENDHRANYPQNQLNKWADSSHLYEFLHKDISKAQAAIRYCLDFKVISTVIPGMLTTEHVNENIISSSLSPYSSENHELINEIYKNNQNKFFDLSLKGKKG